MSSDKCDISINGNSGCNLCKWTTSLENNLPTWEALLVLDQGINCTISEDPSTTTKIESGLQIVLSNHWRQLSNIPFSCILFLFSRITYSTHPNPTCTLTKTNPLDHWLNSWYRWVNAKLRIYIKINFYANVQSSR